MSAFQDDNHSPMVALEPSSPSQVAPAAQALQTEVPSFPAAHVWFQAVQACPHVTPSTSSACDQVGTSEEPERAGLAIVDTILGAQPSSSTAHQRRPPEALRGMHDDRYELPCHLELRHSWKDDTIFSSDSAMTLRESSLFSTKKSAGQASLEKASSPPEPEPTRNATKLSCSRGAWAFRKVGLDNMPNEILTHIFSYLDVCDLLCTSRTSHHFRTLSLQPILQAFRLQHVRTALPPLLNSPSRPTLPDLMARNVVLTNMTQASRSLGRNLIAIRLSRRLPHRPSAELLVQRGVLPPECLEGTVAPGLVARKRAVEKEKLKDGLRSWVGSVWRGQVVQRAEGARQRDERMGTGRVWRLRRYWERIATGGAVV